MKFLYDFIKSLRKLRSPKRVKMGTKSPGGPQRCRLILQRCLAIQLTKPGHTPEDFWMYDSGYMIFQNFLAANSQCWWNAPLTAATRALKYAGHVAPGMLLVTAEPCALEVLRGAYAKSVLKPPATYVISSLGDIEDCVITPTVQGQFTPLPEALCDVIMNLTSEGQSAAIENIKIKLSSIFPHIAVPATEVIYDTLAQLMQERKIYQTSKGYFIVTPERRRSRSRPRSHRVYQEYYEENDEPLESRTILLTNSEALHSLYGEISTERDGDLTHQCIQTNLADIICGGNPNDKILYPRCSKRRSTSFPTPRSLERRHSLRIFGSSKKLQRCASTRSLSKTYAQALATDSSSSEYQSTDSSSPKKGSLLSRLFRRSGRSKQKQIESFSAQFPPTEWFNSRAVHLQSVGTQTNDHHIPVVNTLSNSIFYDDSELSQRSSTLPRRHRRHMSSESTFVISSRDCSPIRRRSPGYCSSSLPRSTQSIPTAYSGAGFNNNSVNIQNSNPTGRLHQHTIGKQGARPFWDKPLLEEQNCVKATGRKFLHQTQQLQNDISNEHRMNYRNVQSGPSSLESGKASSMFVSGPSSIESGKLSYSRTSGHSSLDSQASSITTHPKSSSPSRSILILNGSPRSSSRHQMLKSTKLPFEFSHNTSNSNTSTNANGNKIKYSVTDTGIISSITTENGIGTNTGSTLITSNSCGNRKNASKNVTNSLTTSKPVEDMPHVTYKPPTGIPNSQSNSSITLQVTTTNANQNSTPSTKIFVENSPVRSVITLENAKLLENSNVFIINNETTTNEKGDIIKKTLSKQHSKPNKSNSNVTCENSYQVGNGPSSETCDSISYTSEMPPNSHHIFENVQNVKEESKFTKNINNDTEMNNSRKLSLNIGLNANIPKTQVGNIVYKNVLKHNPVAVDSTTPNENNDTFYGKNNDNTKKEKVNLEGNNKVQSICNSKRELYESSSIGNLQYYEKNTIESQNKLNSNSDIIKKFHFGPSGSNIIPAEKRTGILNSNPAINTDSLAHMLQKSIVAVGSEPNLTVKNSGELIKEKTFSEKSIKKECLNRRLSLSKEEDGTDDLYNFPSLTDLSFNFTSLAAQKILQGVSLNSIDTLVELNMANNKEKQKNHQQQAAICKDYGLV